MAPIQDTLQLIQGYYTYLQLVLYTDSLLRQHRIPLPQGEVIHKTGTKSSITLNAPRIRSIMQQIHAHPTSKNVYGHLGYISAVKGVLGSYLDLYSRSKTRRDNTRKLLGAQTEGYIASVRLCRNLLTHQHTGHMHLRAYDIQSQRDSLQKTEKRIVSCHFNYADIFGKEWKGEKAYGFSISINTATLHTKRTLRDIVDEHTLTMLAESIATICEHYKEK